MKKDDLDLKENIKDRRQAFRSSKKLRKLWKKIKLFTQN